MTLLDTGPLVALLDSRDSLHARAQAEVDQLKGPLVLCSPILTELCFLLSSVGLRRRLELLLIELDVEALKVDDEREWWPETFRWLSRYAEHDPDLADAYLAVASSRHPRARVWTFDSEFRRVWRRLDGRAIPLT